MEHETTIDKLRKRRGGDRVIAEKFAWLLEPPMMRDNEAMAVIYKAFRKLNTCRIGGAMGMNGYIPGSIPYYEIKRYGIEELGMGGDALELFMEVILQLDEDHIKEALDRQNQNTVRSDSRQSKMRNKTVRKGK